MLPTSRHKEGGLLGQDGGDSDRWPWRGLRQVAGKGSVGGVEEAAWRLRRTPRGTGCGSPSPSAAPSSASPREGGWSSWGESSVSLTTSRPQRAEGRGANPAAPAPHLLPGHEEEGASCPVHSQGSGPDSSWHGTRHC